MLGPSGAGKTTLMRVIAGLEVPSAGVARPTRRGALAALRPPAPRAKARPAGWAWSTSTTTWRCSPTGRPAASSPTACSCSARRGARRSLRPTPCWSGWGLPAGPARAAGALGRRAPARGAGRGPRAPAGVRLADEPAGELDATSVASRLPAAALARGRGRLHRGRRPPRPRCRAHRRPRAGAARRPRQRELGPPGEPRRIVVDDRGRLQLPAALIPPGGVQPGRRASAGRRRGARLARGHPAAARRARGAPRRRSPAPWCWARRASRGASAPVARAARAGGRRPAGRAGELVVVAGRSGRASRRCCARWSAWSGWSGPDRLAGRGAGELDRAGAADLRRPSVAAWGRRAA